MQIIAPTSETEFSWQRPRLPMVLRGDVDWCTQRVIEVLETSSPLRVIGWQNRAPQTFTLKQAQAFLGQECDALVLFMHEGFDPDVLAALSGTVIGGGVLLLCLPEEAELEQRGDMFLDRLDSDKHINHFWQHVNRTLDDSRITLWEQQGELREAVPVTKSINMPAFSQHDAVKALMHVMDGQRKKPLVLLADRGRGKSAALGLAAAQLMARQPTRIVITAALRDSLHAVFEHAHKQLPDATRHKNELTLGDSSLRFVSADCVAEQSADLLLVDEAAMLPLPLLTQWLKRFSRMAFASTVHGYEGAGRGFELKFSRLLDEHSRGWKCLRLTQPFRFAENDPLETWVNRLLLLDAEMDAPQDGDTSLHWITQKMLSQDESLLRSVFGLLIQAHYRTRPFDLRLMLDSDKVSVLIAKRGDAVVAAALLSEEGGLDDALVSAVQRGERRPRNHHLPQSIMAFSGDSQLLRVRSARIQRIAVHPECRRQGIGTGMINEIKRYAREKAWHTTGAVFGMDADVLPFWLAQAYVPVALGARASMVSGGYALSVIHINDELHSAGDELGRRFAVTFTHGLSDAWQDMPVNQAFALLKGLPTTRPSEQQCQDVYDFVQGYRSYEAVAQSLFAVAIYSLSKTVEINDNQTIMIVKCIQKLNWDDVAALVGVSGRKMLIERLQVGFRD